MELWISYLQLTITGSCVYARRTMISSAYHYRWLVEFFRECFLSFVLYIFQLISKMFSVSQEIRYKYFEMKKRWSLCHHQRVYVNISCKPPLTLSPLTAILNKADIEKFNFQKLRNESFVFNSIATINIWCLHSIHINLWCCIYGLICLLI